MRGLLRLEASRRAEWIKRGPSKTGLTGLSRLKNKLSRGSVPRALPFPLALLLYK